MKDVTLPRLTPEEMAAERHRALLAHLQSIHGAIVALTGRIESLEDVMRDRARDPGARSPAAQALALSQPGESWEPLGEPPAHAAARSDNERTREALWRLSRGAIDL